MCCAVCHACLQHKMDGAALADIGQMDKEEMLKDMKQLGITAYGQQRALKRWIKHAMDSGGVPHHTQTTCVDWPMDDVSFFSLVRSVCQVPRRLWPTHPWREADSAQTPTCSRGDVILPFLPDDVGLRRLVQV